MLVLKYNQIKAGPMKVPYETFVKAVLDRGMIISWIYPKNAHWWSEMKEGLASLHFDAPLCIHITGAKATLKIHMSCVLSIPVGL